MKKITKKKAAVASRCRVAEHRRRLRAKGLLPRERWAHPDDWPEIDELIQRLTAARDESS